jgi:hypothetical protein
VAVGRGSEVLVVVGVIVGLTVGALSGTEPMAFFAVIVDVPGRIWGVVIVAVGVMIAVALSVNVALSVVADAIVAVGVIDTVGVIVNLGVRTMPTVKVGVSGALACACGTPVK